ncbi:MAG TPA: hypothetical protein VK996_19180 [Ramlibacter sp.]|nr:hypothetical protein [Ramlibacter sp.]
MVKRFCIILVVVLAGCSGMPRHEAVASPCALDEASYACQVERYHNVNVP